MKILIVAIALLFLGDQVLASEATQNVQVVQEVYHHQVTQPFWVELSQLVITLLVIGILFGGG